MRGDILLQTSGILEIWGEKPKDFNGEVCTDTRSLKSGQAYLALNGEQYRGVTFVDKALKAGSPVVMTECLDGERDILENLHKTFPHVTFLIVENANEYFQNIARAWANDWREKNSKRFLIGLTGSNGKTTTKEMLRRLLEGIFHGRVLATEGNLNNQFGVPMTLLRLRDDVEVGVIEMGTNRPGEIEVLANIVRPEAGLITNIGPAHLEFLGDLEGVFQEKIALYNVFASLKEKKTFCFNTKDPYLKRLEAFEDVTSLRPGEAKNLANREYALTDEGMSIRLQGRTYEIKNSGLQGEHNWDNLGLSLLLLSELFPQSTDELVEKARSFRLPEMNRGSWLELGEKTRLYQDAYNANPDSLKASFQTFLVSQSANEQTKLLIILGDMNELGQDSSHYHRETAEWIDRLLKEKGFTAGQIEVLCIGGHADDYREGLSYPCETFYDTQTAKSQFPYTDLKWNGIFLKGSRSLQLESIVDIFEQQLSNK